MARQERGAGTAACLWCNRTSADLPRTAAIATRRDSRSARERRDWQAFRTSNSERPDRDQGGRKDAPAIGLDDGQAAWQLSYSFPSKQLQAKLVVVAIVGGTYGIQMARKELEPDISNFLNRPSTVLHRHVMLSSVTTMTSNFSHSQARWHF